MTDISRGIAFTWKYFLLEIAPKVYINLNSIKTYFKLGLFIKAFNKHACIQLS